MSFLDFGGDLGFSQPPSPPPPPPPPPSQGLGLGGQSSGQSGPGGQQGQKGSGSQAMVPPVPQLGQGAGASAAQGAGAGGLKPVGEKSDVPTFAQSGTNQGLGGAPKGGGQEGQQKPGAPLSLDQSSLAKPGSPSSPEALAANVKKADVGYSEVTRRLESGWHTSGPAAQNPYQFTPQARQQFQPPGSDWKDPKVHEQTLLNERSFNQPILQKSLGRDPSDAEHWIAHNNGVYGAANLFKHPDQPASQILNPNHIANHISRFPGEDAAAYHQRATSYISRPAKDYTDYLTQKYQGMADSLSKGGGAEKISDGGQTHESDKRWGLPQNQGVDPNMQAISPDKSVDPNMDEEITSHAPGGPIHNISGQASDIEGLNLSGGQPEQKREGHDEPVQVAQAGTASEHPYRYSGVMKVGDETFPYATGGRGGGSSPPGDQEVTGFTSGSQRAAQGHSYVKDAFEVQSKFDPALGRNREGVLIHSGRSGADIDHIVTSGCFAVPSSEWPRLQHALKGKLDEFGGKAILRVGADGNAQIVPPNGNMQAAHEFHPASGTMQPSSQAGGGQHPMLSRLASELGIGSAQAGEANGLIGLRSEAARRAQPNQTQARSPQTTQRPQLGANPPWPGSWAPGANKQQQQEGQELKTAREKEGALAPARKAVEEAINQPIPPPTPIPDLGGYEQWRQEHNQGLLNGQFPLFKVLWVAAAAVALATAGKGGMHASYGLLSGLNGFMQGLQSGNKRQTNQGLREYKGHMQEMLQMYKMKDHQRSEILQDRNLQIQQKIQLLKLQEAEWGDKKALAALEQQNLEEYDKRNKMFGDQAREWEESVPKVEKLANQWGYRPGAATQQHNLEQLQKDEKDFTKQQKKHGDLLERMMDPKATEAERQTYRQMANDQMAVVRDAKQRVEQSKQALSSGQLAQPKEQEPQKATSEEGEKLLSQAKDAIARGADREAVGKKLQELGGDPAQLEDYDPYSAHDWFAEPGQVQNE